MLLLRRFCRDLKHTHWVRHIGTQWRFAGWLTCWQRRLTSKLPGPGYMVWLPFISLAFWLFTFSLSKFPQCSLPNVLSRCHAPSHSGPLHRLFTVPRNLSAQVTSSLLQLVMMHQVAYLVSVFPLEWKLQEAKNCIHFVHCLSPEPKTVPGKGQAASKYLLNEQDAQSVEIKIILLAQGSKKFLRWLVAEGPNGWWAVPSGSCAQRHRNFECNVGFQTIHSCDAPWLQAGTEISTDD